MREVKISDAARAAAKDVMQPQAKFCTQHRQFVDPRGGDYQIYNNGKNRRWMCAACLAR